MLEVIRILPIATGAVLARRQATKLLRAVVDRAAKVRYGLAHVSFFIVLRRAPQVRLFPIHFFYFKRHQKKNASEGQNDANGAFLGTDLAVPLTQQSCVPAFIHRYDCTNKTKIPVPVETGKFVVRVSKDDNKIYVCPACGLSSGTRAVGAFPHASDCRNKQKIPVEQLSAP